MSFPGPDRPQRPGSPSGSDKKIAAPFPVAGRLPSPWLHTSLGRFPRKWQDREWLGASPHAGRLPAGRGMTGSLGFVEARQTLIYWDGPIRSLAARLATLEQSRIDNAEFYRQQIVGPADDAKNGPARTLAQGRWRKLLSDKIVPVFNIAKDSFVARAAACYPLELNSALRAFVDNAVQRSHLSSKTIVNGVYGSEYAFLRLGGISMREIFDRDLLVQVTRHCEHCLACAFRLSDLDDPFRYFLPQSDSQKSPAEARPIPPRFVGHRLVQGGMFERFRREAREVKLAFKGNLPTQVSFEALGLAWPHRSAPPAMMPFLPPGKRTGSPVAGGGLDAERLAAITADWAAYKHALVAVLGTALEAGGGSNMVYIFTLTAFRMAPERNGMVIDLCPDQPGIYLPHDGFYHLRSASLADDYLAWLLALLLMSPPSGMAACYSVRRLPEGFDPGWISGMDEHPAVPVPAPRAPGMHAASSRMSPAFARALPWDAQGTPFNKKRKRDEEDHA